MRIILHFCAAPFGSYLDVSRLIARESGTWIRSLSPDCCGGNPGRTQTVVDWSQVDAKT